MANVQLFDRALERAAQRGKNRGHAYTELALYLLTEAQVTEQM